MSTFTSPTTLFHAQFPTTTTPSQNHQQTRPLPVVVRSSTHRRKLLTTLLATSLALGLQSTPIALASQSWGTRSFLRERFFEPGLSPEEAVSRIKQTAEGLHSIRNMLETMSWRYVLFYIRLKQAYLSQDMTNALSMVPQKIGRASCRERVCQYV